MFNYCSYSAQQPQTVVTQQQQQQSLLCIYSSLRIGLLLQRHTYTSYRRKDEELFTVVSPL